jgi:epoxyqueuosine reductase QueG
MVENLTKAIKDFAVNEGAALIGVAPQHRLSEAPKGFRPRDRLFDAKNVISLGMQVPRTVCETWEVVSHNPYRWYGFHLLNRLLQIIAYKVTLFIESKGYSALPFPPTIGGAGGAEISHRHVAVAAGLGEFGLAGYVLTPQYGPRERLISIITNAPLQGDPLYDGPSLCKPKECGYKCVVSCPMGAINRDRTKISQIGGKMYKYTTPDLWLCRWAILGLTKKVGGLKEIPLPQKIDSEDLNNCLEQKDPGQIRTEISQGGHMTYCGKCQAVCPAGKIQS